LTVGRFAAAFFTGRFALFFADLVPLFFAGDLRATAFLAGRFAAAFFAGRLAAFFLAATFHSSVHI